MIPVRPFIFWTAKYWLKKMAGATQVQSDLSAVTEHRVLASGTSSKARHVAGLRNKRCWWEGLLTRETSVFTRNTKTSVFTRNTKTGPRGRDYS